MKWIETAKKARSAGELRAHIADRYPAFLSGRLSECVVIGAAAEGERLCRIAVDIGLSVRAVVDDNPARCGTVLPGGIKVVGAIPTEIGLDTPVIIASHRLLGAMRRMEMQGRKNAIGLGILQTIDPERFPPQMFYRDWLENLVAHQDKYLRAYDLLADEKSRAIFDAIIGYRITGDVRVLEPWVDPVLFYPTDLFLLGKDETYIDGGAFTGDTIELFVERTAGSYSRVIAFEPDPDNFAKLATRFAGESRIEPKNLGLFSDRRILKFASAGGRASGLAEDGDVEVKVTSIDQELAGAPATFIKMNIEGAELEALKGARETIRRWHPRLCVSGYHKASHLWEVPLLIRELSRDYSLYLRQHDGGVIESTFYGLVRE